MKSPHPGELFVTTLNLRGKIDPPPLDVSTDFGTDQTRFSTKPNHTTQHAPPKTQLRLSFDPRKSQFHAGNRLSLDPRKSYFRSRDSDHGNKTGTNQEQKKPQGQWAKGLE